MLIFVPFPNEIRIIAGIVSVSRFGADAVRTYASHLCQHPSNINSLFFLSLVRVPESRVNWGSGFLGGGEVYSAGGGG